ncbi:hypothetical protein AK830_g4550 [Neonectria ditissima]|uniref:Mid2 domain-containing protein n=1 Tax=Neonectria ditissima TaxID=78410 RepID=A0A0P7B671_9HYPO|nr:hypothetical protein AK830_g4550 [Neonectria ditissima]
MAAITSTAAANASFVGTLPTAYTPSSACSAIVSELVVGFDFATSCLPSGFDPAPTAYYSPGWDCPSGYAAPSSCTRDDGSDATAYTVTCCPTRAGLALTCVRDPESLSDAWESLFCTWSAGTKSTVLLVTSTSVGDGSTTTITSAVTMSGGDGINAYGLRMVYEDSDIAATSTSTSTEAETTTEATTQSRGTATATNSADDDDSGGLGTGAIVAIAVVIPLVAIAVAIGIFFCLRRRKRRQHDEPKELPPNERPSELYGSQHAPQELPTGSMAAELPGDAPTAGDRETLSSQGLSPSGFSKPSVASPSFSVSATSNTTPSPGEGSYGRRS